VHRLDASKIPRHVAIIPDGNGRWAEARGLPRVAGYRNGAEVVRAVVRGAQLGVKWLTFYAFSTEWRAPGGRSTR
jgi:undecaprenyl diphosphate synthase